MNHLPPVEGFRPNTSEFAHILRFTDEKEMRAICTDAVNNARREVAEEAARSGMDQALWVPLAGKFALSIPTMQNQYASRVEISEIYTSDGEHIPSVRPSLSFIYQVFMGVQRAYGQSALLASEESFIECRSETMRFVARYGIALKLFDELDALKGGQPSQIVGDNYTLKRARFACNIAMRRFFSGIANADERFVQDKDQDRGEREFKADFIAVLPSMHRAFREQYTQQHPEAENQMNDIFGISLSEPMTDEEVRDVVVAKQRVKGVPYLRLVPKNPDEVTP